LMNRLQRFFIGRNGPDQLSLALMIAAIVLNFIPYAWYVSFVFVALALFRMLSKNVVKRRSENDKFMMAVGRVKSGFMKFKSRMKERKYFKIFKCPGCGQCLRVPKNKGKISITCVKCGKKFIKRT